METLSYQSPWDARVERPGRVDVAAALAAAVAALARELGGRDECDVARGRYRVVVPVAPGRTGVVEYAVVTGRRSTTVTRVVVGFEGRPGRRALARPTTAVDGLMELLGFLDVHVGDAEFDRRFVLTGSDPALVRGIFGDADVRAGLIGQRLVVSVGGRERSRHVTVGCDGRVAQADRLRRMLALAVAVADRVVVTGGT